VTAPPGAACYAIPRRAERRRVGRGGSIGLPVEPGRAVHRSRAAPHGDLMRTLPSIGIVVLAGLMNGCVYIGSASETPPDGQAAAGSVGQSDALATAPRDSTPRPRTLRLLGLAETAALPGRLSEPPMGIPSFDVAVVDYELAESYPNPIGGIERPAGDVGIVFVLVRATNVSPVRGRPPQLTVALGETALRGCPIAPGDRAAYEVMRDALPDETVEGWLCRVVPSVARADEISVRTTALLGVRWRLDRLARGAP